MKQKVDLRWRHMRILDTDSFSNKPADNQLRLYRPPRGGGGATDPMWIFHIRHYHNNKKQMASCSRWASTHACTYSLTFILCRRGGSQVTGRGVSLTSTPPLPSTPVSWTPAPAPTKTIGSLICTDWHSITKQIESWSWDGCTSALRLYVCPSTPSYTQAHELHTSDKQRLSLPGDERRS